METNQCESDSIENKTVTIGKMPSDLWEPITAFSNADGGYIRLGIDINGHIVGIDPKFHDSLQSDIISYCKSGFSYKIYPDIEVKENVISIYIPPAPAALRPIYSIKRGPNGAKIRVGTTNVQVDEVWIKRFAIAAKGGAELMTFAGNYKEYYDTSRINNYLTIVKNKRGNVYKNLTTEEILRKLRSLDENNNMTLFGLLAFSNEYGLQELSSPTLNIAVTQYSGTTKVNPSDVQEVSLDDREFNGNAVTQFEESLKFIQSKLPVRSKIETGGKRLDYLAIPEVAIREVLANTIVHRDYTTQTGKIQIDIFADRIEFINPGRSLVPLDQLESAHSQTRNPLLMNYLRDLHITEHRGRGITTIKYSLKSAGLAEPSFIHRYDWFVATLYSSAFINNNDQVWLQNFSKYNLKGSQLNALVYIRHNPEGINNSDYRNINNMTNVGDDIRAKKELNKLVILGIIRKFGEKRYTRYLLT